MLAASLGDLDQEHFHILPLRIIMPNTEIVMFLESVCFSFSMIFC